MQGNGYINIPSPDEAQELLMDELFEIVRENYYKANADYIAEQIEIANGVRK